MLKHRLLLGPVLIAVALGLLYLDNALEGAPIPGAIRPLFLGADAAPPGLVIFTALLAISFLASRELARILAAKGIAASKRITTFAAILGLLVSCIVPQTADGITSIAIAATAALSVLLVALLFYSRNRSVEGVVAAAGGALLAFTYLGLLFGFLLAIRREHSAWVILWVILTTKSSDIGAYFTGRAIGRHKLIPWLSPGKTWEGLVGGFLFSGLVGGAGAWVLAASGDSGAPSIPLGAFAGVIFGLLGQLGDLVESMFKRDAGRKDSGTSVPGFGGVLDVADSILMVAPVAFWLLRAGAFSS